jgi:hypothetical protein
VDRRCFLLTSLAGAFAVPVAAGAQQTEKVYRIGVLSPDSPPPGLFEAFKRDSASLVTLRAKTSRLSRGMREGRTSDSPLWQMNS